MANQAKFSAPDDQPGLTGPVNPVQDENTLVPRLSSTRIGERLKRALKNKG